MAIKKSELYSSLWASCDELRGGMDASHGKDVRITLFGQEKDSSTAGLARMNMILHDYATAEIKQGNTLAVAVQGELDRVSQTLTGRIRQLAERYATPLPQLIDEVAALENNVNRHLERMGFKP